MSRDIIRRAYTGGWGSDARRDRRIDRARRKEVLEREVRESNTGGERPFNRCMGCGERFCDGC